MSPDIKKFVLDRIRSMCLYPEMWGTEEEIEANAMLLLEFYTMASTGVSPPSDNASGILRLWQRALRELIPGCRPSFPPNNVPLRVRHVQRNTGAPYWSVLGKAFARACQLIDEGQLKDV